MMSADPLLRPYQLRHLRLKNRIMSTAHEPNYAEGGMPTDRYRLYHVEKARGGIAMTMTAGSAIVAEDSPAAFGNLYAYKDEIVPWLRRLADDCHAHDCAVMIQLTHLGRRTMWNHSDWLPVVSAHHEQISRGGAGAVPLEIDPRIADQVIIRCVGRLSGPQGLFEHRADRGAPLAAAALRLRPLAIGREQVGVAGVVALIEQPNIVDQDTPDR